MTSEEFAQLVRGRLLDANQAAQLAGYAFRQGFWRAIAEGLMPEPVLRFPNMSLWDLDAIIEAKERREKGAP